MKRLVLRNLRQRKIQVVSVVLAIAVSVMAFVSLFLLYGGMSRGVALSEQRSGAQLLVVPAAAESQLEDSDLLFTGAPVSAYLPASIADDISRIDGVKRVTVQFYGQTMNESCCSTSAATRIIGFDPKTDWVIAPYADHDISGGLGASDVVIGCNVTGFESGNGTILGKDVHVVATLEPTGTYLDNSLLMDIDEIRAMSEAQAQFSHYWEKYGEPKDIASAVLVETDEGAQEMVAGKINRKVDGDFGVIVRSDVVAAAQNTLSVAFTIMLAAGVILAIASLLQFVARFFSLVWERKAELALYRALGATTHDLRMVIGGEAFAITGMGAVLGIALGAVLYNVMLAYLQDAGAFPFSPFPVGLAVGGVAAIIVGFFVVAALTIVVPLRQVSRIDPASAMQQVDIG